MFVETSLCLEENRRALYSQFVASLFICSSFGLASLFWRVGLPLEYKSKHKFDFARILKTPIGRREKDDVHSLLNFKVVTPHCDHVAMARRSLHHCMGIFSATATRLPFRSDFFSNSLSRSDFEHPGVV